MKKLLHLVLLFAVAIGLIGCAAEQSEMDRIYSMKEKAIAYESKEIAHNLIELMATESTDLYPAEKTEAFNVVAFNYLEDGDDGCNKEARIYADGKETWAFFTCQSPYVDKEYYLEDIDYMEKWWMTYTGALMQEARKNAQFFVEHGYPNVHVIFEELGSDGNLLFLTDGTTVYSDFTDKL